MYQDHFSLPYRITYASSHIYASCMYTSICTRCTERVNNPVGLVNYIVKISRFCCSSFLLLLLAVCLDQILAARSVEQPICSLQYMIFFAGKGNMFFFLYNNVWLLQIIFGHKWRHLKGERDLWEHYGGVDISLDPCSFGQANTLVCAIKSCLLM